jgi:uncharacterized protein (DUF1015 family)
MERATGKRWSFLHISKPEIDLPDGTDPYSEAVYAKAAENMTEMLENSVLIRDPEPFYYAYRITWNDHQQTGLVASASVAEYDKNRIRKHEFTRPAKEDDRVRQIEAVNAQTGPVLLAYPAARHIDDLLEAATGDQPDVDVTADDGVRHSIWAIKNATTITALTDAFEALPAIYIADGHHRSAAASRVCATRKKSACQTNSHEYFLSVIFPHHQTKILDYNRVVRDLNGLDREQFLHAIRDSFAVNKSELPVSPSNPHEFGMYLAGEWYRLSINAELVPANDPVAKLSVSLLSSHLIKPVLAISDPRRDERIDFVGGIRGLAGLEKRVDSGEMAVAFSLYPTSMEELMAVADDDEVMPPKSTWFEPKLADGLISHVLD